MNFPKQEKESLSKPISIVLKTYDFNLAQNCNYFMNFQSFFNYFCFSLKMKTIKIKI